MPRYSDADREKMVALWREGLTGAAIAKRFGCSPTTVSAALVGEPPRLPGPKPGSGYGIWRRRTMVNGYIGWYARERGTGKMKWLLEHRLIMAWLLGHELRPGENVHHRDGNRANNDPANLELWVTQQPSGATHCPHCGLSLTSAVPHAERKSAKRRSRPQHRAAARQR